MRSDFARRCVAALDAAVLVVVASCSGGDQVGRDVASSTTDPSTTAPSPTTSSSDAQTSATPPSEPGDAESTVPLRPDWPLGGIWLASGLDSDGDIVEPRLVFSTDDVAVAAVVALGADVPVGATLVVEWFGVRLDERVTLFTHEIPVGPGGLAVSRGAAPGGLAPGFYEVVATLGDHQTTTPWIVREAKPDAASATGLRSVPHAESATAPEPLEPPSDDDYDWTGERGTPLGPEPPPGPCEPRSITAHFSPITSVYAWADWAGICMTLKIAATVSGAPATLYSGDVSEFEIRSGGTPSVDVCDLPGGSDMPGTVVHFDAHDRRRSRLRATWSLPTGAREWSATWTRSRRPAPTSSPGKRSH